MKASFQSHPRPLYAWFILIISIFFQFSQAALIVSLSVLDTPLKAAFSVTFNQLAIMAGLSAFPFLLFQFPIGILIDKYGIRKMTSLGVLIIAIGTLLFGLSQTITIAYLSRFIMGCGASFAFINAVKIISNFFHPKKFALLVGVTFAMGMLGAYVGEFLVGFLAAKIGWRLTMIDLGIFGLLFAVFFFIFVRDNTPGAKYNINPEVKAPFKAYLKVLLKKKQTWIVCLYGGLVLAPVYVINGLWGIPFLVHAYHFSLRTAVIIQSTYFISCAIMTPLIGYISTLVKRRVIFLCLGSLIGSISIAIMHFHEHSTPALLILLYIIFGIVTATFPLAYSVIHEKNNPCVTATAVALINSFFAVFAPLGDQLFGFLLDYHWHDVVAETLQQIDPGSFSYALVRTPAWLFIAFLVTFLIKETYAKQKTKDLVKREHTKQA